MRITIICVRYYLTHTTTVTTCSQPPYYYYRVCICEALSIKFFPTPPAGPPVECPSRSGG